MGGLASAFVQVKVSARAQDQRIMSTHSKEQHQDDKRRSHNASQDSSNASEIGVDDDSKVMENKTQDRNYADQDSKE
jgi:hypothetical protein